MEFTQEELFEAVDRLVNGLLERAGVVAPPVDALHIAEEHLGIPVEVVEPVEEDERGRPRPRSRLGGGSGIVLSPDMTEELQQRTAADGIARTLLPDIFRRLDIAPGTENRQTRCFTFKLLRNRLISSAQVFGSPKIIRFSASRSIVSCP